MTATRRVRLALEDVTIPADVPEGWASSKLESCSALITKGTTPTSYGFAYGKSGVAFVRVENLADGRIDRSTISVFINKEADYALKRSRLKAGDLLFSIAGTIGRTGLVTPEDLPANTNQALAIIRGAGKVLDSSFLRFALASSVAQRQVSGNARGGGMNNISLADMRSIELPVPPEAEQKRIVSKIKELLCRVSATHGRLAKTLTILTAFRQSVLAAACSGRLTEDWREPDRMEADEWKQTTLDEAADTRLGKMLDHAKNVGALTRYLRNVNVRWFSFDLSDLLLMRATQQDKKEFHIENGDLLVCEGGEPGRCAVWNLGPTDLIFQKAIHRIRLKSDISPYWLALNLKHDAKSGALEEYFTGSGIKHMTGRSLATYVFQVPPSEEQREIVRRVEALFRMADTIEARVEAATKRAKKLTQAILAKAFRGELVPTEADIARKEGRAYEPASVLLERIKAEREKAPAKRRPKRHAAKRGKK